MAWLLAAELFGVLLIHLTVELAADAGRRWQTATLLKLLSRLEERGFVKREKEGRNNLYTPLVRREDYLSAESRAFLQRLHGGSLPSLVAALMDSRAISRRDLEELEEILRGGDGGA